MEFLYNYQILKIKKKVLLFNFQDELLSEIDKNNARAFPNQEKLNGNLLAMFTYCNLSAHHFTLLSIPGMH